MRTNKSIQQAKNEKNDEFYTQLFDIENELKYYTGCFENKVVYCNCDNFEKSNFFNYFQANFETLKLKKLICSSYNSNGHGTLCIYYGGDDAEIRQLQCDGDFRSQECIDILKTADIVVTNPPFSLFRSYVAQLIEFDKKFIIIGALNAVKYKEIFPMIKENKLWLGVHGNFLTEFEIPDNYCKFSRVDDNGVKYAKVHCITWFTNIEHENTHTPLQLTETYNETSYPKYDDYDAIEVSRTVKIPKDYKGVIGVPISFLTKYCKEQFEIIGELNHGCDNKYDLGLPVLKGKYLYPRILIRHKNNAHEDTGLQ